MVLLGLNKVENPRNAISMKSASAPSTGFLPCSAKMAVGLLRQRQHAHGVPEHSLCRPQCHARSAHGRHYRPRAGDAGGLRCITGDDKRVKKAIKFILSEQEPDGSWFGRWGVNYIYGTMLVLRGLQAMGVDHHEPYVQQGAEWLRMVQNSDGGWGETCGSYDDPTTRGIGPSTPSQTAWAIMGLLAAGDTRSESVQRGILYLLETQRPDGHWDEDQYTGTGFRECFTLLITCIATTSR